MTHCYMCFTRFQDYEVPVTDLLPALHPECHRALANSSPEIQNGWLDALASGELERVAARTRELEDDNDYLELRIHGENSQRMVTPTAQAVERLIYAVSLVEAGLLPEDEAPTIAALAWKADHHTRLVTISDEELARCAEAIRPAVAEALHSGRFLQAKRFRQFLRNQADTAHSGTRAP